MKNQSKLNKYKYLFYHFGSLKKKYPYVSPKQLVAAEQVHSDNVNIVGLKEQGTVIKSTDGLVTTQKNIILGIKTADCLPIIFFDPEKQIIGIIHSGWKGTVLNIACRTVKIMQTLGSSPKNIIAVIGPHIGACCYAVDKERFSLFIGKFGSDQASVIQTKHKYFLDLGRINFNQLIEVGVPKSNIEFMLNCTSCQSNLFYSYRRQKEFAGRMLNVVGMLN